MCVCHVIAHYLYPWKRNEYRLINKMACLSSKDLICNSNELFNVYMMTLGCVFPRASLLPFLFQDKTTALTK